jgi:hypothetical protein
MAWKNSSGFAIATPAVGLLCLGCVEYQADNTNGQDGDIEVITRLGEMNYANSTDGDAITIADVGNACFAVDNQTLAKTSNGNSRALAGYITGVDADGSVWVKIKVPISAGTGMVGANNLEECTAPATARANIGANKLILELDAESLVATGTPTYRIVCRVPGNIIDISAVLEGHALTTGDAIITPSIVHGGTPTPVTDGAVTLPYADGASAIGDTANATPSAANTVVAGDVIEAAISGTNDDADATAKIAILIAY